MPKEYTLVQIIRRKSARIATSVRNVCYMAVIMWHGGEIRDHRGDDLYLWRIFWLIMAVILLEMVLSVLIIRFLRRRR